MVCNCVLINISRLHHPSLHIVPTSIKVTNIKLFLTTMKLKVLAVNLQRPWRNPVILILVGVPRTAQNLGPDLRPPCATTCARCNVEKHLQVFHRFLEDYTFEVAPVLLPKTYTKIRLTLQPSSFFTIWVPRILSRFLRSRFFCICPTFTFGVTKRFQTFIDSTIISWLLKKQV